MGLWYRVFGRHDELPVSAAILEHLNALGMPVRGDFVGDETGWFQAELTLPDMGTFYLERFLSNEEGIRAELNNWAAYLETCDYSPNHGSLMEWMIQTRQLFTLRRPVDAANEVLVERLCLGLCQFLARSTDGVYQADDEGFFAADGALLLKEY